MVQWAQRELVHGEGDNEGEPFRLGAHLIRATYRLYEHDPLGLYLHRKALIGYPKGQAKTEWECMLGLEELEGPAPVMGTPVVTVAAVDGDQADELVRIAAQLFKDQPLSDRLDFTAGKILQRDGEGRMLATSAALGKNDGKKTSLLLCDEIHEWDAVSVAGAKRHGILERNANKRQNGRQVNVTTAGWSLDTLAGAMYVYGCQVAAGEVVDPTFLFEWWEAAKDWDLEDPEQLIAAICEANAAIRRADGTGWLSIDNLIRSYREHVLRGEVLDFVRYHLNRWVGVLQDAWMDLELWNAQAQPGPPPPDGTPVVLGFDGSQKGDSTAIVGCTIAPRPRLFVVGCWEADPRDRDWEVPITEVEDTLVGAVTRWQVKEIPADLSYWRQSLARLADRGLPIVEFFQSAQRMAPACQLLYEAISRDMADHDGDPRFTRHIGNCRTHWTPGVGTRVVKEHAHSKRHIDLAIAGIMAHDRALFYGAEQPVARPRVISLADALAAAEAREAAEAEEAAHAH